jgi:hypothetical protein
MNIYNYNDDEIMKVLQKTIDMIEQDKDRAIHIYEVMLGKMEKDDGNLVVLTQMADRYLEQASRATDNILKLASVMQRLKAARDAGKGKKNEFKDILASLELETSSPFMQKNDKGEITVGPSARPSVSEDPAGLPRESSSTQKPEEKTKNTEPPVPDKTDEIPPQKEGDIALETDFD